MAFATSKTDLSAAEAAINAEIEEAKAFLSGNDFAALGDDAKALASRHHDLLVALSATVRKRAALAP